MSAGPFAPPPAAVIDADVAAALGTLEARQLAYEMAVCVCDADGVHSLAEQDFLDAAKKALGLQAAAADRFTEP